MATDSELDKRREVEPTEAVQSDVLGRRTDFVELILDVLASQKERGGKRQPKLCC